MHPSQPVFHRQGHELLVRIPEGGVAHAWLAQPLRDLGLTREDAVDTLRIEAAPGWRWTSTDAGFLVRALEALRTDSGMPVVAGAPAELEKILALACGGPRHAPAPDAPRAPAFVTRVGLRAQAAAREGGAFLALLGEVVLRLPRFVLGRAQVRKADVVETLAEASTRALALVAIVNMLMGAILAFVGAVELRRFGAGIYVADLVGVASVRELTPILTAIVLAGRTGASFAARLATMQGNEEIDALTTLGISPFEFLVVPRVACMGLLMPLLYVYGCACSIAGGLWVAAPLLDVSPAAYWAETQAAVAAPDFAIGCGKAAVFGALVGLLGCHFGLRAQRSAAGVGWATTQAVVVSIVGVIALDAVFAVCANALGV